MTIDYDSMEITRPDVLRRVMDYVGDEYCEKSLLEDLERAAPVGYCFETAFGEILDDFYEADRDKEYFGHGFVLGDPDLPTWRKGENPPRTLRGFAAKLCRFIDGYERKLAELRAREDFQALVVDVYHWIIGGDHTKKSGRRLEAAEFEQCLWDEGACLRACLREPFRVKNLLLEWFCDLYGHEPAHRKSFTASAEALAEVFRRQDEDGCDPKTLFEAGERAKREGKRHDRDYEKWIACVDGITTLDGMAAAVAEVRRQGLAGFGRIAPGTGTGAAGGVNFG